MEVRLLNVPYRKTTDYVNLVIVLQLSRCPRVYYNSVWDPFAQDTHRLVFGVEDPQRWRVVGVGLYP